MKTDMIYRDDLFEINKSSREISLKFLGQLDVQSMRQGISRLKDVTSSYYGNSYYIDYSKIKEKVILGCLFLYSLPGQTKSDLICKVCGDIISLSPTSVRLHGNNLCIHCHNGCSYCVDLASLLKISV